MRINASYQKYVLKFKFDAGTSRGILREKTIYFIFIRDPDSDNNYGVGECGPLPGLSLDDRMDLKKNLDLVIDQLNGLDLNFEQLNVGELTQMLVPEDWPSIRFGLETALLDLQNGGQRMLFSNDFTEGKKGLPINGLIWMGGKQFMLDQIDKKLEEGYTCLKLKIGAIEFETELSLLKYVRQKFSKEDITLRFDANGAFSPESALSRLEELSKYDIHSIEQPIWPRQLEKMREVCLNSPIPIALDEELIGIHEENDIIKLLETIQPHYIILKPTLIGGLYNTNKWINLADKYGIGWWITSALESNVGLNAIAQYTAHQSIDIPQGLGTGQLFHNNISSPLFIHNAHLAYDPEGFWDFTNFYS